MSLTKQEIDRCRYVLTSAVVEKGVVITFLIVSVVEWLLLVYTSVLFTLVVNVLVCGILSFFYQGLKHASPNGGNSRHAPFSGIAFLGCLLLGLADGAGMYLLAEYAKTDELNTPLFVAWLVVCVGGPLAYVVGQYGWSYWQLYQHSKYYVLIPLDIYHDNDLPIYLDKIEFVNTTNGKKSCINPVYTTTFYTQAELNTKDVRTRMGQARNQVLDETIYIPKGTDTFYLSWYSPVEDQYYSDSFPFKFDRFALKEEKMPYGLYDSLVTLPLQRIEAIDIHIKPDGMADLYKNDWLLWYYWDVAKGELTAEQKNNYLTQLKDTILPTGTAAEFQQLLEEIKTSGRLEKRVQMQKKTFLWKLTLEGLGEMTHRLTIHDVNYNRYDRSAKGLNEPLLQPLPEKIHIYKSLDKDLYFHLNVYLDREKLHDCVQTLTEGDEEVPVDLTIHVTNRMKKEMTCTVQVNEKVVIFSDWQIQTTGE